MNHKQATELFATCRDKYAGKPLPGRRNSTRLIELGNGDYAVRYHNTNVVTIHADGTYTIDNGGFRTNSTKERINLYSPVNIYRKDFEWYFADGKPYVNGRVDASGRVRKAA